MRVFTAALATETNTFAPIPADRRTFEDAFYAKPGEHPETPTLCTAPLVAAREAARQNGLTLIEGTAATAEPAGLVSRAAYESLRDEILDQLKAALPVDVVVFGLHGAMVAHGYDDPEGDLLARARALTGPKAVIGAELDLHAHLTPAMTDAANVIIAFKEFPHVDFMERARELVDICLRAARSEIRPHMAVFDCRMIAGYMTSREPGRSFVDRLQAMEGKNGVLSISVIHGFQAADVPEVGTKVLVITDGDAAKATGLAESLGRELIAQRGTGGPEHLKPDAAIRAALEIKGGPVTLADRWDNPGGGVAGDSTFLIHELLKHPDVPSALGILWDPVAVSLCMAAGEGAVMPLRFGGKAASTSGTPVDATVTVTRTVPDARFKFRDSVIEIGDAAAIRVGNLDVVLGTRRVQTFDPSAFTNLGVDLARKKIVVVKSSNHFYAGFAPISTGVIYVDCGGPYPSDPRRIAYTKIRRPIWPLDENPWG